MGQLLHRETYECVCMDFWCHQSAAMLVLMVSKTVPVNQHTVSFLTPTGSCHIWQKDTFRHCNGLPELSFIHLCGPHFNFPLIYQIYNLC